MVSVRGLFFNGKCAVFEGCKNVGDIMLRVALSQNRLASDVVVLLAGSGQVLTHDAAAPKDVSIMLKNEEEELEEEEWKTNIILHAKVEDAATVARALAMLGDIPCNDENFHWPECIEDILLDAARDDATEKILRTLVTAGIHESVALAHFAKQGDAVAVQSLTRAGVNVNNFKWGKYEALVLASRFNRHTKVVKILINARAEVNYKFNPYYLCVAGCATEPEEIVRTLIEARAVVNEGASERSNLFFSCCKGNKEMVQVFIDAQADVNHQSSYGFSCLDEASSRGDAEIVRMLIFARAQLSHCGDALIHASSEGHADVVEVLIDELAQPGFDGYRCSALYSAAKNGHTEVVEILLDAPLKSIDTEHYKVNRAFHEACFHGRIEIIQLLVDASVDINGGTWSALHRASVYAQVGVMQVLIDARADVNITEFRGITALMLAAKHESKETAKEMVQILIDARAEVNRADRDAAFVKVPTSQFYFEAGRGKEIDECLCGVCHSKSLLFLRLNLWSCENSATKKCKLRAGSDKRLSSRLVWCVVRDRWSCTAPLFIFVYRVVLLAARTKAKNKKSNLFFLFQDTLCL